MSKPISRDTSTIKPRLSKTVNKKAFVKTVKAYYKKHGRHDLPWRLTSDPYCILVSEVMLQQTQVERVQQKFKHFIQTWPQVEALAEDTMLG